MQKLSRQVISGKSGAYVLLYLFLGQLLIVGQTDRVKDPGVLPKEFFEYPVIQLAVGRDSKSYHLVDVDAQVNFSRPPTRTSFLEDDGGKLRPAISYETLEEGLVYKVFIKSVGTSRTLKELDGLIDDYRQSLADEIRRGRLNEKKLESGRFPLRTISGVSQIGRISAKLFVEEMRMVSLEVVRPTGPTQVSDDEFERKSEKFFDSYRFRRGGFKFDTELLSSDLANGKYGNYYFNFTIELPNDWTIWNDRFSLGLLKGAVTTLLERDNSKAATGLAKSTILFVSRPTSDITGAFSNTKSSIIASTFKDEAQSVPLRKYAQIIASNERALNNTAPDPNSVSLKYAGRVQYAHITGSLTRSQGSKTYFSRNIFRRRGYIVIFEFGADNTAELANIEKYFDSVRFLSID